LHLPALSSSIFQCQELHQKGEGSVGDDLGVEVVAFFPKEELKLREEVSGAEAEGIAAMVLLVLPRLESALILVQSSRKKTVF
jgi:hypothetical protein